MARFRSRFNRERTSFSLCFYTLDQPPLGVRTLIVWCDSDRRKPFLCALDATWAASSFNFRILTASGMAIGTLNIMFDR